MERFKDFHYTTSSACVCPLTHTHRQTVEKVRSGRKNAISAQCQPGGNGRTHRQTHPKTSANMFSSCRREYRRRVLAVQGIRCALSSSDFYTIYEKDVFFLILILDYKGSISWLRYYQECFMCIVDLSVSFPSASSISSTFSERPLAAITTE